MRTIVSERENGSRRVQLVLSSESKVEQHHVNDVNINSIIKRYNATGLLPQVGKNAVYGDFTNSGDYHDTVNRILNAQRNFDALPSDIRTMFDNEPANLIDFVDNPENAVVAAEMGLIKKAAEKPAEDLETLVEFPEDVVEHPEEPAA